MKKAMNGENDNYHNGTKKKTVHSNYGEFHVIQQGCALKQSVTLGK